MWTSPITWDKPCLIGPLLLGHQPWWTTYVVTVRISIKEFVVRWITRLRLVASKSVELCWPMVQILISGTIKVVVRSTVPANRAFIQAVNRWLNYWRRKLDVSDACCSLRRAAWWLRGKSLFTYGLLFAIITSTPTPCSNICSNIKQISRAENKLILALKKDSKHNNHCFQHLVLGPCRNSVDSNSWT